MNSVVKSAKRNNFAGKKAARAAIFTEMRKAGVTMSQPTSYGVTTTGSISPGGGKLQQFLSSTMIDINPVYKNAANVFMNPGHEGHALNALPLPDGTSGDVYLHKSICRGTIVVPANDGGKKFHVVLTPFVEFPAAIQVGAAPSYFGFPDTKMYVFNGTVIQAQTYLRQAGVYAQRCIGKSITIDNETPIMYRAGNITVCHMPSNIDNNAPSVNTAAGLAAATNTRRLQGVPLNAAEASMILSAANWPAEKGVYAVSRHETLQFENRCFPWEKCSSLYTDSANPASTDVTDNIMLTTLSGTDKQIYIGTANGIPGVDTFDTSLSAVYSCHASAIDHTDTTSIYCEGLNTGVADNIFKMKMVIVREFKLKTGSPLLQMAITRPPRDDLFMQMLVNYANSLPGFYPADFNFWDTLWSGFKKVIGRVSDIWGRVSPIVTPLLPPAGQAAAKGADTANEIYRLFNRATGNQSRVGPGGIRSY
jgi:hypothetical protein